MRLVGYVERMGARLNSSEMTNSKYEEKVSLGGPKNTRGIIFKSVSEKE
jgi:hypothetical protein